MRHQPVDRAEQGGLARPGRADHERERPLVERHRHVGERRLGRVRGTRSEKRSMSITPTPLRRGRSTPSMTGSGAANAGDHPDQHSGQRKRSQLRPGQREQRRDRASSGATCVQATRTAALATPEATATSSASCQRSGRYAVRSTPVPDSASPVTPTRTPATRTGIDRMRGVVRRAGRTPRRTRRRARRPAASRPQRERPGSGRRCVRTRASPSTRRAGGTGPARPPARGSPSERSPRSLDRRLAFGTGRSRRARRTRTMLSASCGNTDSATTTAVLTSCSAGGIDRSSRRGLASAFAAPRQISIVASRSPS